MMVALDGKVEEIPVQEADEFMKAVAEATGKVRNRQHNFLKV